MVATMAKTMKQNAIKSSTAFLVSKQRPSAALTVWAILQLG
jgi:hypothetical protein